MTAPDPVAVTAVVVNWNGVDDLPGCLATLQGQDHRPFEVVVVDNASTDGSDRVLSEAERLVADVPVRVVRNATNRGFAGGANDGIAAAAGAGAVLVCNPDVRPAPDFVSRALGALSADDAVGAVQGRLHRTVRSPSGEPVIDTTGHLAFRTRLFRNRGEGEVDRGQWDRPGEVFGVSGALALYRRAMLDDVAITVAAGGAGTRREVFDEDLFAFWEDVDLDWRAAMRGWRTAYEPRAVAVHERGGAGPRRTARVEALNWANRLLVLVKDDTAGAIVAALPGLVVTTVLKTLELAVTAPSALVTALRRLALVPVMWRKRAAIHPAARVASADVVRQWFAAFDYGRWVRTWWRRVRGRPLGEEPVTRASRR